MDAFYANLIPMLWLLWLGYWFVAGRNVKTTVRHESLASRAGHLVPVIVGAWLLWRPRSPGGLLDGRMFATGMDLNLVGAGVVAVGLAFSVWARIHLGRNWSGTAPAQPAPERVRAGPNRYARHQIYTGLLIAFIGCAVARNEWRGMLAIAIIWAGFWRKLKLEERWMAEQFGDAYRRYIAEVPALIPNPFRSPRAITP